MSSAQAARPWILLLAFTLVAGGLAGSAAGLGTDQPAIEPSTNDALDDHPPQWMSGYNAEDPSRSGALDAPGGPWTGEPARAQEAAELPGPSPFEPGATSSDDEAAEPVDPQDLSSDPCRTTVRDMQEACSLWVNWHQGPAGESTYLLDSAVSADGTLLALAGYVETAGTHRTADREVVVFDTGTGQPLWSAREDLHDDFDGAYGVTFSPSGDRVILAGESWRPSDGGGLDDLLTTTVFDASDGDHLFTSAHNLPFDTDADPMPLEVSPGGDRLFVLVELKRFPAVPGEGFLTVAVNLTQPEQGEIAWSGTFAPNDYDHLPRDLGISPDGETVYVVGGSTQRVVLGTQDISWAAIAYDAQTGEEHWRNRHNPSTTAGTEEARKLVVSPDGEHLYLVGAGSPGPGDDYHGWAARFDASDGSVDWSTQVDDTRAAASFLVDLALSPDGGTIYATGSFATERYWDLGTVAISTADGAVEWSHLFDRHIDISDISHADHGFSVAVGEHPSTVYVVGRSATEVDLAARLAGNNIGAWGHTWDTVLLALEPSDGSQRYVSALSTSTPPGWTLDLHIPEGGTDAVLTTSDEHPDRSQTTRSWLAASYGPNQPAPEPASWV